MKLKRNDPPRIFKVGSDHKIQIKDCAHIELEPNEQITLFTENGAEFDVARKEWGYYATPSLNGRLKKHGLRAVLVKSPASLFYVWLVEKGKEAGFQDYLNREGHVIISWLDDQESLEALERRMAEK